MGSFTRKFQREAGTRQVNHHEKLRKALRALQSAAFILRQYADETNWAQFDGKTIWLGEGNGPELAQKVLGTKKDEKKVQPHEPQGPPVQEGGSQVV